ncbi:MAG TPA: bifunctional adenosylcobinamide kinase/adenosylcobinamide-phosphate guanylyltransferase [Micromonosporaceae bacterium]|nr:bifunctional adenosylcobinamide kinase/adenosylcobinamide-phosphate guanylyltransferase [Micromonosporaceae bacterium]
MRSGNQLTVLFGGARSGKSRLAVAMAAARPRAVTVIATGRATDPEMADRIRRHRAERPADWGTVEEPVALGDALAAADGLVVVDCLTLWVANLIEAGLDDHEVEARAAHAAALAAKRPAGTIAVTNEVGWGLVPMHPLGRRFRDVAGRVNAAWSAAAGRAFLVVAGRVLPLHKPEEVVDDQ